jgi:uncharacterized protein (TIGR00369 family)
VRARAPGDKSPMHAPHLDTAELQHRLEEDFPQAFGKEGSYRIETSAPMRARLRLLYNNGQLRPGGTISGPAMFGLADCALYVAVLATIGWVPLAVTTGMTLNFLSRPAPRDLVADCRLMRVGRRLAVGEVSLRSDGEETLIAHATGTYAIPRKAVS